MSSPELPPKTIQFMQIDTPFQREHSDRRIPLLQPQIPLFRGSAATEESPEINYCHFRSPMCLTKTKINKHGFFVPEWEILHHSYLGFRKGEGGVVVIDKSFSFSIIQSSLLNLKPIFIHQYPHLPGLCAGTFSESTIF